jgi:hypothetical protein
MYPRERNYQIEEILASIEKPAPSQFENTQFVDNFSNSELVHLPVLTQSVVAGFNLIRDTMENIDKHLEPAFGSDLTSIPVHARAF